MYSSYTAASFARIAAIADSMQVNLAAAMSWAFEFEGQRYFDGFRDLATNGIDKPVLNVFRMFGLMRGNRIPADNAFVTADRHSMYILLWNYTDDDLPGPAETKTIAITHLPTKKIKLTQYRIDDAHSNSYEAWKKMGSPQNPTTHQYQTLEAAGLLQQLEPPKTLTTNNITVSLPAHAVAFLKLEWASAAP
jgi:xylan 1,4-beta-xylosidase